MPICEIVLSEPFKTLHLGGRNRQGDEVREPVGAPFVIESVNVETGTVTMGRRQARWTASFAWNLYESLVEIGAVEA